MIRSENPDVYSGHEHFAIQESATADGSGFILADIEEWVDEKTAHLIAAAPTMLSRLKSLLEDLKAAKELMLSHCEADSWMATAAGWDALIDPLATDIQGTEG